MLSLSPRYDLFKISFPKDFLPKEVEEKYYKILNQNAGVITTPIDYLNESIQGVNMPGISDILIQQQQHGINGGHRGLGKINVEPKREHVYRSTANPLEKIAQEFKVTMRVNQGLYNYFMMYEVILQQMSKTHEYNHIPVLRLEILNASGNVTAIVVFKDVLIDGIDGLEFSYNKVERESNTFDVNFKYNNIDFEFTT
jgi:hypothetical protein